MRRSLCFALTMSLPLIWSGAALAQDQGGPPDARVIELEAHASLQFMQDGEPIWDLPVVPGETVTFRIDNTAGFDHNFYIGTEEQLAVFDGETDVGIPTWWNGVQELVWTVPSEIDGLLFGCTVPGHIYVEHGLFSQARALPDGGVERVREPVLGLTELTFEVEWDSDAVIDHPEDLPGGRIELPWARVALTLPSTWVYEVDPAPPDEWKAASVLHAHRWVDDWTTTSCGLDVAKEPGLGDGPPTAEDAAARGWDWDQVPVTIAGEPATRTDWTISLDEDDYDWLEEGDTVAVQYEWKDYVSQYDVVSPHGWLYTLWCHADEYPGVSTADLPDDRWLSFAETFEFLPAGE